MTKPHGVFRQLFVEMEDEVAARLGQCSVAEAPRE